MVSTGAGKGTLRVRLPSVKVGEGRFLIYEVVDYDVGFKIVMGNTLYLAFGSGRLARAPLQTTLRHCLSKGEAVCDAFERHLSAEQSKS